MSDRPPECEPREVSEPARATQGFWRRCRGRLRAAQRRIRALPYWPRKVVTLLLGGLVFGAGVVMLVAPGPGLATIGLSIVILAGEFAWAKRAWKWLVQTARWCFRRVMGPGERLPSTKD